MTVMEQLFVVLHNVHSTQRIKDMAKLVTGFGLKSLIVSKAEGAAAISGIPEAQKIMYKEKRSLLCFPDLPDVIELLKPEEICVFVPRRFAKETYNPSKIAAQLKEGRKILFVFGGSEPGLSKREMDLGRTMSLDVVDDIGPVGTAAIVLYELMKSFKSNE